MPTSLRHPLFVTLFAAAAGCGAVDGPAPPASLDPAAIAPDSTPIFSPYGWQAAWTDVGSPFGAAPALVSWGPGRVDLFMKNGDQLIQKTRTPASGWIPAGDHYWYIASGLASDPSAVGWSGTNIDVVYRAPGNNVMHVYWDGKTWTTQDLGGIIDGKPTISVAPDGTRMDVFARVGDRIWHRDWIAFRNGWNAWENLNLVTDSDPVAVSWGRGHVDLFYRATNGDTRRYTWDGGAWTQYLAGQPWVTQPSLGGFAKGPPTVASQGAGSLDVFVQGGDDGIYRNRLGASGFLGWTRLAGCTYGTPSAAASDTLNIVVREKNTHRILHNFESSFPSTAAGTTPMCCGLLNQSACASTACDPSVAYQGGMCVQCGWANEPACINEPQICQPGLGMDADGYCRVCPDGQQTFGGTYCRLPHVLNASKGMDGSIHVDVSLRAVETGGFAIHPHATNYNEVTGFMYLVNCHVGDHELAFMGHVGPDSFLNLSGPGRDDPGIKSIQGASLAGDWPTTQADWNGGIGTGNFDCTLSTWSTLAQTLDDLWSTIAGAYMKAYGFDDLTKGHLCVIDCGIGDCPAKCAGGDIQECSGEACDRMYGGL